MGQRELLREGVGQAGDRVFAVLGLRVHRMDAEDPALRLRVAAEEAVFSLTQSGFQHGILPHIEKCRKAPPCAAANHVLHMRTQDAVGILLLFIHLDNNPVVLQLCCQIVANKANVVGGNDVGQVRNGLERATDCVGNAD